MTNSVEIVVKGKNEATRVFVEVEHQAVSSARKAEDEWSKSANHSSASVAKFGTAAEKAGKKAETGLRDGAKKGGKATDDEMSRVAARTNATFDAMKFGGLSIGLPAAAAAGVAGVAGALALVPGLFIGAGVAMIAENQQMQESWQALGNRATRELTVMSSAMQGPALGAMDKLGAGFTRLEPQINTAMIASSGYVGKFADAIIGTAENAMPGLVVMSKNAGAAIDGVGSFAKQSGAGVSEMLINMSRGSADAGAGMTQLGGTTRNLLAFMGNLATNLASNHQELGLLDATLTQAEQGILHLTAAGGGAIGFLHGFGAAGTGAITVLSALATGLSALPAQVTQFGGSFTASAMILSKFGVDATAKFDGMGDRIKAASKESGLFKATMSELSSAAINPATIATAGLSVVLWGLGEAQKAAAARAQDHKNSVTELTEAIRKDKGVVSDSSMEVIAHNLTQKNAAANLSATEVSFGKATVAASGNAMAMRQVTDQTNHWIQTAAQAAGAKQSDIDLIKSSNQLLLQQGGAYNELNPLLLASGQSQNEVNKTNEAFAQVMARLGPAQANHLTQLLNGTGAIGEQARATREATDAYQLQEQGLTDLSQAQIQARDDTTKHTEAIYEQVNASLGLRGAQLNTKQALDDYNKTMKDGKKTADEKAGSLLHLEEAQQRELDAIQKTTEAHSQATTPEGRHAESMAAMNARAVEMANSFQGHLSPSLVETISKMSVAEAKAAGLTVAIDGTGQAVYRLPNGKYIRIDSNADQEAAKVQRLRDQIAALHDRDVDITVHTFYQTAGKGSSLTGPYVARASGGPIGHAATGGGRSGYTMVGEQGPELVKLPTGSFVNPAGSSTNDGLQAAARELLSRVSSGGSVYEDLSYRGMSSNLGRYNDQLAGMFGSGGTGSLASSLQSFLGAGGSGGSGASGAGTSRSKPTQIYINLSGDDFLINYLKDQIRIEGGDVQTVLGVN